MRIKRCVVVVGMTLLVGMLLVGQSPPLTHIVGTVVAFDEAFGSVATDVSSEDIQKLGAEVGDLVEVVLAGHVLEIPLVSDMFPYLPQSLPGLIVWGNAYIVGWYSNIAEQYGVSLGDEVIVRLLRKGAYLDEMAERDVDQVERRDECTTDEEYANFREVSCGSIASGVLFRSSHPADGSERSPFAHSLMVQAGVRTIINVGASWNDPQQAFDSSEYYQSCGALGRVLATNIGLAVTWDHFKTELRRVLRFIIDNDPPYLIHCRIGQDRTGIAIAILEALAGANLPNVINDYAATFENYYEIRHGHMLYFEVVEQLLSKLREMNGGSVVTSENLQSVIKLYITKEVGMSESELTLLQERLSNVLSIQDDASMMLATADVG